MAACRLGTWSFQCDLWTLTGTAEPWDNGDVQPLFSPIQNDISLAQEGDITLQVTNTIKEFLLNPTIVRSMREAKVYLDFLSSDLVNIMYNCFINNI